MPRWVWVLLAVLVCAVVYVAVRHHRAGQHGSVAVSNRPLLLSHANATLRSDPSIADAVYNPAGDQWDATPASADADPRAFGRYVCFLLKQGEVAMPHTSVRVIDDAKLEASGFDYAAASRGIVMCGGNE